MNYSVRQTEEFAAWLKGLRNAQAQAAIVRRLDRAAHGNLGDVRSLREGLSEMRVDMSQGYRLYFVTRSRWSIVLVCGGDKKTQQADIKRALQLVQEYGL